MDDSEGMDLTARLSKSRMGFRMGGGPPKSEAEEIAELMSLGINHPARKRYRERMNGEARRKIQLEKGWNGTPMRTRPAELRGIRPITREPWAIDEEFYQKKTGSFEYEYNSRPAYDDRSVLSASKGYLSAYSR